MCIVLFHYPRNKISRNMNIEIEGKFEHGPNSCEMCQNTLFIWHPWGYME